MVMESGELLHEPSVIELLGDAGERGFEAVQAVLGAVRTLPRRRARSKPAARIGRGGHEESKPAK